MPERSERNGYKYDKKIAVLNFANAYHPGGGVIIGARAQEEDLCRVSTLYLVLATKENVKRYYGRHSKNFTAYGTSDILYSPDIFVFRFSDDEYTFRTPDEFLNVDVITCAAPQFKKPLEGGGDAGVDGAIHKAAGKGLYEECKVLNGCETGEAKMTDAYNLGCKKIIHTIGPIWEYGCANEEELLKKCYQNCLDLAVENNLRTIAFPSISTGSYNFPIKLAAKIALDTVKHYIEQNPEAFDEIRFVLLDWMTMEIYNQENEYTYLRISVNLKKNIMIL